MRNQKPTVFIGSSGESLQFANILRQQLNDIASVELWTEVFDLGENTIEGLFRQLNRSDYAVLIVTGDDLVESRGIVNAAPMDNVIFEAGFFMARLGRRRAFILCDTQARPKLPTDLAGIVYATFDSSNLDISKALESAAEKLIAILSRRQYPTEVDFIRAYLTIVQEETDLSDTYADIIRRHLETLFSEVNQLKNDNDWHRLLEVKKRIREFFEFSGLYEQGAQMGKYHVLALRSLGRDGEALWPLVEDVGYMLILADHHKEGRDSLLEAIKHAEKQTDKLFRLEILFYAYRYMGISYMRQRRKDLKNACRYFQLAYDQIQALDNVGFDTLPLKARLERNFGRLDFERKNYVSALQRYRESLSLFKETDDMEHIGITHLAIAQVLLRSEGMCTEAIFHLGEAENICDIIHWVEGQGRVLEQKALFAILESKQAPSTEERELALKRAENAANRALAKFDKIRHLKFIGRIERILEEIEEMGETRENEEM